MRLLKPDVIVITGDITDYGDSKSFELAAQHIERLRRAAGASQVICIPGNHDALCERAADIRKTLWGRLYLGVTSLFSRNVEVLSAEDTQWLSRDTAKAISAGDGPALLRNFERWREAAGFAAPDPSSPVYVEAGWGKVAFFLFNSTNDPGVMANEGRIGQKQFNTLNECLQNEESKKECDNALRVALLHHHPISAPYSRDAAYNRGYDWMADGPLFLQYMNRHNFHFILHGHQHEAFYCSVNYRPAGGALRIVAAGSATQGRDSMRGSFNLIDLLTPFHARLRRYDYTPTGFDAGNPSVDALLPVRPTDEVRVTRASDPETVEDWAMRGLVGAVYKLAYDLDAAHVYDELDFEVVVTKDELYKARYRRSGRVVGDDPSEGPVFIISGSPGRKLKQLNIVALDREGNKLGPPEVILDESNRKILRVRPRALIHPGESFDVTLCFEWQGTDSEPNHFDGLNLMYLNPDRARGGHVAHRLSYSVTLPREPVQPRVRAHGIKDFDPELEDERTQPVAGPGGETAYRYSFEIEKPQPVAYLILFEPPPDAE
jgi:predicted phosphodiesterase